jgi:hypothetical protein
MTVVNETENEEQYMEQTYPEFLEMLCRFAVIKFEGSHQLKTWSLNERLEIILDAVLKIVKSKLVKVDLGDLQATESDEDY